MIAEVDGWREVYISMRGGRGEGERVCGILW